jgi:uncharacterized membrane protein (DUF4010 family)
MLEMIDLNLLQQFIVALALGGLIGLEREYARYKKKGNDFAGIRTFPLIGLFGAIAAYLGDRYSIWIFIVSILVLGLLIVVAYSVLSKVDKRHTGATSEIAAFLTFFIGSLAYFQEITLAVIIAIVLTIILYSRSFLHKFAEKISNKEMTDTLKFLVIAFVILPFLPNQAYGPFGLFNPFVVWLMVVFISGIGFVGYILMKWFGEKGIEIAGILGGLVSSTATTTAFAERSKKSKKIVHSLVLGVILANAIMFLRILIEVSVLNKKLFLPLALPLVTLFVLSLLFAYYLYKKQKKNVKGNIHLDSPFTLKPALKFGLFFALILALVKLAEVYFSSSGVYLISFISGFADVDAITVSLSQLAGGSLSLVTAEKGILLAAITNIGVKGGIAYWFGRKEFGKLILGFFSVLIVIGLLFFFLV